MTIINSEVKGGFHETEAKKKWLGGLGCGELMGRHADRKPKEFMDGLYHILLMTEATRVCADKWERGGHLVSPA